MLHSTEKYVSHKLAFHLSQFCCALAYWITELQTVKIHKVEEKLQNKTVKLGAFPLRIV